MADIFISYANEDRERAAQLARFLESEGWPVWWDRRIPAGRSWRSVLESALEDTRCMIVLWSEHSIKSPWVAEEAEEARRLGRPLVPVLIQRVEPPMGFRAIQAADLTDWDGSAQHPAGRLLIADLRSLLNPTDEKTVVTRRDFEAPTPPDRNIPQWVSFHWPKAAIGAIIIVAFLALWNDWFGLRATSPEPDYSEKKDAPIAPAPRVTELSVNAERRTIKTAETVKVSAQARYSDGSQTDVSDRVEWLSTDRGVATVDKQGEVKGVGIGTTRIIAKIADVESAGWSLAVEGAKPAPRPSSAPRLVALNVSAAKRELIQSERIELRAKGRYSDDSEKYLSSGVEWEISDRTVASLNDRGELVARRPGKIRIVARSDELASAPLILLVRENPRRVEEQSPPPIKATEPQPSPSIKTTEPPPSPPPTTPALSEQAKARIAAHIERAHRYREQGNYAAALAELEKAQAFDAASENIRKEIEQTKRACNAEKVLGNQASC